jgi:hypothetical protein
MSGYRTWTPGEVIRAEDLQEYLQNQSLMVFPSDAVRSTAIVVPLEGMLSWVEDDDKYQYYDGASWIDLIVPIEGGTIGQAYVSGGTAPAAFGDVKAEFIQTTLQNKSANYIATAGDVNTVLNFTSSATVTFPDVATDIGDRIDVIANTSGTVFLAAGSGVTNWAGAGTAGTGVQFYIHTAYAPASVIKTGSNEYRVIGQVSA